MIIERAQKIRQERWWNQLFLMPPLYISDGDPERGGCLDHCVYCPWRHGNVAQSKLRRLKVKDVWSETLYLLSRGYGDVELVAATDPELLDGNNAAQFVVAACEVGAKNVGINFFPLPTSKDYSRLTSAGCTFTIVWQETYLPDIYKKMHPRGPKANFAYRLDAHDRALIGGIKTVGVAFLGGLTDWRFEALATITHALYLRERYSANVIFGMPRWKHSQGLVMDIAPEFYGDEEYEFVGALYSLVIPEALVWFSTREHFEFSARCVRGGGCMFTLDCSTAVGGYNNSDSVAQFPVYSRSYNEGVKWLKSLGFNPQIHLPW